jgi:ribosome biogenesis GTPase
MPSDPWSILTVFPRRTVISRGAAGTGVGEQVLAANVDRVWIVHGLDMPLNARRLERYLAVVWDSGATPEIVLAKADLAEDLEAAVSQVRLAALGATVRYVSSEDPISIQDLRDSLSPGCTVSLLGPSGVGKSTLVNLLAGETLAKTGAVRELDRKGRHTTVRREIFRIPGGALLLDTPGIRELRIGAVEEGLREAFADIQGLAANCRFRDCRHEAEPGCAVLAAVDQGTLDPGRLASFRKLQAEAAHEARKADPRARAAHLSEWKTAIKTMKHHPKHKG